MSTQEEIKENKAPENDPRASRPEEVMVPRGTIAEVRSLMNHKAQRVTIFQDVERGGVRFFGTGYYTYYPEGGGGRMKAHAMGFDMKEDRRLAGVNATRAGAATDGNALSNYHYADRRRQERCKGGV